MTRKSYSVVVGAECWARVKSVSASERDGGGVEEWRRGGGDDAVGRAAQRPRLRARRRKRSPRLAYHPASPSALPAFYLLFILSNCPHIFFY